MNDPWVGLKYFDYYITQINKSTTLEISLLSL